MVDNMHYLAFLYTVLRIDPSVFAQSISSVLLNFLLWHRVSAGSLNCLELAQSFKSLASLPRSLWIISMHHCTWLENNPLLAYMNSFFFQIIEITHLHLKKWKAYRKNKELNIISNISDKIFSLLLSLMCMIYFINQKFIFCF